MVKRRNKRKESRDRRIAWNNAIRESRVVRFDDRFVEYRSAQEAQAAVDLAKADERPANIVDPALALSEPE